MSPAVPSRSGFTFRPWRSSKPSRHSSTRQTLNSVNNDERMAAILHAKQRNGGKKVASKSSSLGYAASHPSPHPSEIPSRHNAQHSALSEPPTNDYRKGNRWEGRGSKSTKRKARADAPVLQDEYYVRRTMRIPTPQEYPFAPDSFFKNPQESIRTIAYKNSLAECRSEFVALSTDAYQCTAYYNSAMHNEAVIGEGRTHTSAENTAWLRMVAKFHEQGILQEILDRDSGVSLANREAVERTRVQEADAILDIYNYAARFDAVPKISTIISAPRAARRGRRPIKAFGITVELPEQGIRVESEALNLKDAEIKAAKRFKEEAEKYQREHGSEIIVVKDSGALTTDNASKFMSFYKMVRRGVDVEVSTTQPRGKASIFRAGVKINGEIIGETVEMGMRKKAEDIAYLTAAIALKNKEPELYSGFLRALKKGNGQILRPIAPVDMYIDENSSLVMRETLLGARGAGLPDVIRNIGSKADLSENRKGNFRRLLEGHEAQHRNEELSRRMTEFLQDPELSDLRNKKAQLPMNQYQAQVLDLVNNNVYSIIVGATGSGKTTQVPQILLEDAISKGKGSSCNIVCTQPRRIAAISVARRVAVERAERLQDSVGYHVRFDAKLPQVGGSVTYCTTGILQQQLQHFPDEVLDNLSHLVIDEVHERDMLIDFLLIILKKNIMRRQALGMSNPQVVLMSATLDTELFASYFQSDIPGKGPSDCPLLSVPGRTFPVKERYLEEIVKDIHLANSATQLTAMHSDPDTKDYLDAETIFRDENPITDSHESADGSSKEISLIDWKRERNSIDSGELVDPAVQKANALIPFGLVACTIAHITQKSKEGAILVFLPGLTEIMKVEELLRTHNFGVDFNNEAKFKICLLHSSLPAGQNTVFDTVPEGCRKIILSTNIAETSVTIPDVQYVVDTGKLREKQYDQTRGISQLLCTWISKSNSRQRAGRAGRVQNGNYYALFTKQRYEKLRAIGLPELLRIDLQEICLQVKAQASQAPIRQFLAEAIEPPDPKAVDLSIVNLQGLDALTEDEALTPLGRLLSSLPVHPSLGKMIVLGIIFRCLDPMIILGSASAERSLFVNALDNRGQAAQTKLTYAKGSGSDHIALLNAVRELRRIKNDRGEPWMKDFAFSSLLHVNAFKTIYATAQQIEDILVERRLIPRSLRAGGEFGGPSLNENSHTIPLVKALALAGFQSNLAIKVGGGASFRTMGESACMVHPSSINAGGRKSDLKVEKGTLYMYGTMARSNDGNSVFLRDTTKATPLMASLFGGRLTQHEERGNILELDSWLPFYVTSPDRRTPRIVLEFRKGLERLLALAFNELGHLSSGRQNFGEETQEQRRFLADDRTRRLFGRGLVEVLEMDAKNGETATVKGWGKEIAKERSTREAARTSQRQGQNPGPIDIQRLRNSPAPPGRSPLQYGGGEGAAPQARNGERQTERRRENLPQFYNDLLEM